MPAIQPARLKKQVTELTALYNQPTMFVRQLHALLDMYSDHTHRRGQSGEPLPLVGSYNAPPPVLRQLWYTLEKTIQQHPAEMLILCDALWAEQNYDLQLLAARILGQLPIVPSEPVIERLQAWIQGGMEKRLLDGLLEHGMARLLQEAPNQLLELVASWLHSGEFYTRQAGLRASKPIVKTKGADSVPPLFHLITPYLRICPMRLRPDILAAVSALARCSPSEMAYLLRQNLAAPDNPDTAWLIRQVQNEFPEETRAGLRTAMKETSK